MSETKKREIHEYGLRALLSSHPNIRKLKSNHTPSEHGSKLWDSTWLLIDFLSCQGFEKATRVMDIGCGWGLAGIYCAKKYGVAVSSIDIDPEVLPFLRIHAQINKIELSMVNRGIGGLKDRDLNGIDIIIGAEICYSDRMGYFLKWLINRALRIGVRKVFIADPGRPDFDEIGEYFEKKHAGEILNWTTRKPRTIKGHILKIESLTNSE
jgi:predicted nicotinamide N-methyase